MISKCSPLVSVVIPNYNNERFLSDSISSVINQTYKNIEIIVVDDFSTDDSIRILEGFSNRYENFKYVVNDKNMGVSFSRNLGIKVSKGEYISTLDSDDIYYLDKIEKEVAVVTGNSGKGRDVIAFSNTYIVDEDLKYLYKVIHWATLHEGDIFEKMLYRSIPFGRDLLISREIIDKVGTFNEKRSLYEDWEHKLKLAKVCDFYFSGSNGVKYRQIGTGLSSAAPEKHKEAMKSIFTDSSSGGNLSLFTLINSKGIGSIIKRLMHLRFINEVLMKLLKWVV
ncbi:glycosyltransferase family 2 protein [Vibrio cionasavignyae]|uniref:glycosyltransferase family 2 protein n=1 Tax=Vibrio cionasavignyae TaxID=2910252 RepID=UPI003D0D4E4B